MIPPRPSSLLERALGAALLVALGVFLLAITIGVLGARYDGSAVTGFFIRAFFTLLVGGIGLMTIAAGVGRLREGRASRTTRRTVESAAPPPGVLALCPGCGERVADESSWCTHCDHPMRDRAGRWQVEEAGWGTALVALGFGGGLLCLGAFLAVGSFVEGERRIWMLVAFVALGGLIALVGAAALFGTVAIVTELVRRVSQWKYAWTAEVRGAAWSVTASAITIGGRLVHARGSSLIERAACALPARTTAPPAPRERAFARALAVLHRAGLAGLWSSRRIEWAAGSVPPRAAFARDLDAPSVMRTDGTHLMMQMSDAPPPSELRAACEWIGPHARDARTVRDVWRDVQGAASVLERCSALDVDGGVDEVERQIAGEIVSAGLN